MRQTSPEASKSYIKLICSSVLSFVLCSSSYAVDNTDWESTLGNSLAADPQSPPQELVPRSISAKEAAFKQFYKRDPACDSFKDDNMMDRCRHAYITAKQEFEKIWAARNESK